MEKTTSSLNMERLQALVPSSLPESCLTVATSGVRIQRLSCGSAENGSAPVCMELRGSILPLDPSGYAIEWEILLPFEWNGRTVQVGGGANCGHIPMLYGKPVLCEESPIKLGYVVYGDDSGHQSEDPMSADFAANQEALDNYIRLHLIKTRQVMEQIVTQVYGQKPAFNFFIGGSAGGREALECAIHYGSYYEGIFCASPVSNFVLTRMWGAILSRAVYRNYRPDTHPYSDGFIDEETVRAIQQDAIRKYDALDGIEDGLVCNIPAARAQRGAFLQEIRGKYHLTDAQVETIRVYEEGFQLSWSLPNGYHAYSGYSALEGGLMDLGPDPVPREPLDTRYNVHHGDRSDGMFKYFITKDPTWKLLDHDYLHPDAVLLKALTRASAEYDVNGADLDTFVHHGGKLILFAAWNDMSISPWQIVKQYQGYRERYGQDQLNDFCRFFIMPGVRHCVGAEMRYISWLDRWCTEGHFPTEPLDAYMLETQGRLPMASYPGWIRYRSGDPKCSSSYEVCDDGDLLADESIL